MCAIMGNTWFLVSLSWRQRFKAEIFLLLSSSTPWFELLLQEVW